MVKDFVKMSFEEKCRRQDRLHTVSNIYFACFIVGLVIMFTIPFYLVKEASNYQDISKVPQQIVSQIMFNVVVLFIIAVIFLGASAITFLICRRYRLPDNISVALALKRIDKIKTKSNKQLTDPECVNFNKPYRIIESVNFRTLSSYFWNRRSLSKFKNIFFRRILKILLYLEPSYYNSIRSDLLKIIDAFEKKRYADIRALNESLEKKISKMEELKKYIRPSLSEQVKKRFRSIFSHVTDENIERMYKFVNFIWVFVKLIALIASVAFGIIVYLFIAGKPELLNELLSNPAYAPFLFITPISVAIYIGVKVIIILKKENR